MIEEIVAQGMDVERFIQGKVAEIREAVGSGTAINALSGGVDSSVVTMLGHRALGDRLKTVFVQNGLMREGEAERVVELFRDLGVEVRVVDARKEFFDALKGLSDPGGEAGGHHPGVLTERAGPRRPHQRAKYLLQGTILTDVEETVAGSSGSTTSSSSSASTRRRRSATTSLEPLVQLRKDGVRKVGMAHACRRACSGGSLPGTGPRGARYRGGDAGAYRGGQEGEPHCRAISQGQRSLSVHGDPP
jgi:GMP synthase (glutamine-hydrolysing)